MGNSSSQWLHHQQHQHVATADPVGWAHSYPRERGRQALTKVLPEREPGRRLRLTDNGAILSGGGTISGRREQHIDDRPRVRSTSVHAVPGSSSSSSLGGKRFGSEPDLRASATGREHSSRPRINHNRGRKKYKAPAPPPGGEAASSSPDSGRWEEVPAAARRLRLFKTRAETRRSVGIPRTAPEPASHPPLMRSLSSPEFQAELVRAAQRLRPLASRQREAPVGESSPRPAPLLSRKEVPPPARSAPEKQHWEILPPASSDGKERDVPAKTFYFGMEQEHEAVDRFAASLHRVPPPLNGRPRRGGSLSSEGADSEAEEDIVKDIALQLRPTLPKKTPEIPRFSPTAAWRLLSALDQAPSSTPSTADDASVLLEERIQRLSRPVAPPVPQAPRSKSGDSGISGDASPGGCPEDSVRKSPPQLVAWTPQQDLEGEEESSSDGGGGGGGGGTPHLLGSQPKFSPRPHVFSLSLPRDDRLCLALYSDSDDVTRLRRDTQPPFNSLQKLKKSVSGAIGVALGSTTRRDEDKGQPLDENWLLSRSVPNSLNNGHLLEPWGGDTPSSPSSGPEQDKQLPFSYLANGGHVMYLPQYQDQAPTRRRSSLWDVAPLSKSCENVSEMRQVRRTPSPEQMAVAPTTPEAPSTPARKGKARRFTFQSTVRQIERRKLAERLSREAEMREKQRLSEVEAMRQVEEEFQRKRAREKASIRQQLRLFSLDENLYSSLPTGWGDGARADPDGAPASSPASSPVSSGNGGKPAASRQASGSSDVKAPGTQVLSEFREPRREYRDYRPSSRYIDSAHESLPYMESKRATVHPQVVYDIPKNTQVYVSPHHQMNGITSNGFHNDEKGGISTPKSTNSDNYRRDFAHGTRPTGCSLASSDSELSQSNNLRPLSRQGRNQLIHHQRSRSSSPEMCTEMKNPETVSLDGKHSESEEHENYTSLPPGQLTTSPAERIHRLSFTSIQPFVRNGKGYRPIVFNPGTSSSHKVAQTVS